MATPLFFLVLLLLPRLPLLLTSLCFLHGFPALVLFLFFLAPFLGWANGEGLAVFFSILFDWEFHDGRLKPLSLPRFCADGTPILARWGGGSSLVPHCLFSLIHIHDYMEKTYMEKGNRFSCSIFYVQPLFFPVPLELGFFAQLLISCSNNFFSILAAMSIFFFF